MTSWLKGIAVAALSLSAAGAAGLDGYWQGTLETASERLRVVFKIAKGGEGYSATLDSLDQGVSGIAVESATLQDRRVRLEVKSLGGIYAGQLSDDGQQIAGEWTQGRTTLLLMLRRGEPPKARDRGRPLTTAEREKAVAHLERTRKLFLASVEGLTGPQVAFKTSPQRWSILECAEHLALAEDFLFAHTVSRVMAIPPTPERPVLAEPDLRARDELVLARVADRSLRAEAPEPLKPLQRFPTLQAAVEHFNRARTQTADYARTTQDDMRSHITPGPPEQQMDAYEFLLMMAAHTERHTKQIQEVKASAGYPK
jgi:DinB family protein